MSSIEDRARLRKENPATWVAVNPGDHLDGDMVEVAAAWSDVQYDGRDPQSGYYPLLRVKVRNAEGYKSDDVLAVHCFAAVLRDRILTQEPINGEHIVITYDGEGEAKTKGRNAPQLYRVEMPDRDPEEAARKAYSQFTRGRAPGGTVQPQGMQQPLTDEDPLPY